MQNFCLKETDRLFSHLRLSNNLETTRKKKKKTQTEEMRDVPERGILSPLSKEPSPWLSLMYGLPQLQTGRVTAQND